MISLFNTVNSLKQDILILKSNIQEILDIIKKQPEQLSTVQDELNEFLLKNSESQLSNRFLNIFVQPNIFDFSNNDFILSECNKCDWKNICLNDKNFNIIEVDDVKSICNDISTLLYDKLFPILIKLYELKNVLHICFNVIDLFFLNVEDNKMLNIYTKNTIFTICISLEDNKKIKFNNEKTFLLNKGDAIIYCGNQENYIIDNNEKNVFLIINVEMNYYK